MKAAILVLVGFLALCAVGYGALDVFAGSMSDAPIEGAAAGKEGAVIFLCGLSALIGCCAYGLFSRR